METGRFGGRALRVAGGAEVLLPMPSNRLRFSLPAAQELVEVVWLGPHEPKGSWKAWQGEACSEVCELLEGTPPRMQVRRLKAPAQSGRKVDKWRCYVVVLTGGKGRWLADLRGFTMRIRRHRACGSMARSTVPCGGSPTVPAAQAAAAEAPRAAAAHGAAAPGHPLPPPAPPAPHGARARGLQPTGDGATAAHHPKPHGHQARHHLATAPAEAQRLGGPGAAGAGGEGLQGPSARRLPGARGAAGPHGPALRGRRQGAGLQGLQE